MIEEFDIDSYLYISPNEFQIYLFDKKNLKNLYEKKVQFNNTQNIINFNTAFFKLRTSRRSSSENP